MTPAHFERWAASFEPPDEEELRLFDEPAAQGRRHDGIER
jgi:hypothetical protein